MKRSRVGSTPAGFSPAFRVASCCVGMVKGNSDDVAVRNLAARTLEDMRVKNRMTEDELRFAIQAAELSGRIFSRFDPETKRLRWYWCGNE
jgi:hypothetical protein